MIKLSGLPLADDETGFPSWYLCLLFLLLLCCCLLQCKQLQDWDVRNWLVPVNKTLDLPLSANLNKDLNKCVKTKTHLLAISFSGFNPKTLLEFIRLNQKVKCFWQWWYYKFSVALLSWATTICSHFIDLLGLKIKLRLHIHIIDLVIITMGRYKDAQFHSPTAAVQLSSECDCSIACLSSMTLAKCFSLRVTS